MQGYFAPISRDQLHMILAAKLVTIDPSVWPKHALELTGPLLPEAEAWLKTMSISALTVRPLREGQEIASVELCVRAAQARR